jgi:hypothetical protein
MHWPVSKAMAIPRAAMTFIPNSIGEFIMTTETRNVILWSSMKPGILIREMLDSF